MLKSNYANRGMGLENDINLTNEYYISNKIALIYKKATPIKINKFNYSTGRITDAFFETQSTLDYNGIYKGKYIEFDAKETKIKTSFPLANIHKHQIEHIKNVLYHNGIVFLIVRFSLLNKDYLILGKDLISFIENNDRKSIPIDYFIDKGYLLELKYSPRIDYIKIIDSEVIKNEN